MVLAPFAFLLALLPPLALQLMHRGVGAVMAGGAFSLAVLAGATSALTPEPTPAGGGSHPVEQLDFIGIEMIAFAALALIFVGFAAAHWVKLRLNGLEDRAITLSGFWLAFAPVIAASALPQTPVALTETLVLAGLFLLVFAILLRPIGRVFLRRVRPS